MAKRVNLTTTDLEALRPLGYQGSHVYANHRQIVQLVANRLSPRHAALFAEPVVDPGKDKVDWYVRAEGPVQRLSEAPPETQEAARQELVGLLADLQQTADQLLASEQSHEVTAGKMLSLALNHPGQEEVYLVGDQPVLAAWSMTPADPGAPYTPLDRTAHAWRPDGQEVVSRRGPGRAGPPPPPPGAPPPVEPDRRRGCLALPLWLLALLAGLLMLLLLLFGLRGCGWLPGIPGCGGLPGLPGLGGGSGSGQAPAPEPPGLQAARQRGGDLRAELERLNRQWHRRQAECRPEVPEPPAPVEPPQKAEPPEPPPPPEPEPEPKPEELVIPEEAQEEKQVDFLQGKWVTVTDLKETRTGRPVVIEYEFNKEGNGRSTVVREDGSRCHSDLKASWDKDGNLVIKEQGPVLCPDGTSFRPSKVECKVAKDGRAICRGTQSGGNTYRAVIKRRQ